jgi:cobalt-precorrin 5A hydrolase
MKLAVIALTKNALSLGARLSAGIEADLYGPPRWLTNVDAVGLKIGPIDRKFGEFVGKIFDAYEGLVFIMACGIVVRSIAPYLQSKTTDPAVVVVDEQGRYAISLSGGHWGGANELAKRAAAFLSGQAVITTATDLRRVVAFDLVAKANEWVIENYSDLKTVSAALLNGEPVGFFTDCRLTGGLPPPLYPGRGGQPARYAVLLSNSTGWQIAADLTLLVRPRNLIIGIGCKKGTGAARIAASVTDFLAKNHKSRPALKLMATIDLKASEPGIVEFCQTNSLPLGTFSPEAIRQVEGQLSFSPFVHQTVGVGGVAEPCALLGGVRTRLVCPKTVYPGLTLALAEEEKVFRL